MFAHVKSRLTTLVAALVLATAIGTASAHRFEVTSGSVRIVWPVVTFSDVADGSGIDFLTSITVEGSFHSRIISKVSGTLIGSITSAHVSRELRFLNGNRGANEEAPTTLPWHIRYDSFGGTLPNISRMMIQVVNASFLFLHFEVSCLYESTAAQPLYLELAVNGFTGMVAGLNFLGERGVPLKSGSRFLCFSQLFFRGSATVTQLGNTTAISVRLVA